MPSEKKLLRAMSLSSPRISRDGSRVGLLSPLGCWPLLTAVAVCEDDWNRVSAPLGISVTQKLAGKGSMLFSSAVPVGATAKMFARCWGRAPGALGAKQRSKDTTTESESIFLALISTNDHDNGVNTRDFNVTLRQTVKFGPLKSINKKTICPVIEALDQVAKDSISNTFVNSKSLALWACAFFRVITQGI